MLKVTHTPKMVNHFLEQSTSLVKAFIIELRARTRNAESKEIEFNTCARHLVARFIAKFLFSFNADDEWIMNHYNMVTDLTCQYSLLICMFWFLLNYSKSHSFQFFKTLAVPLNHRFLPYNEGLKTIEWFRKWIMNQVAVHRAHPEKYDDTTKQLVTAEPKLTDDEVVLELLHLLFAADGVSNIISGALILLLKDKTTSKFSFVV